MRPPRGAPNAGPPRFFRYPSDARRGILARMRRRFHTLLSALLLVAGCATPPPPEAEPGAPPPEEGPAAAAEPGAPPPEEAPAAAAEPGAAPSGRTPEAGSRPWEATLEHGRSLARVDGVQVFLDAPARTDRNANRTSASWLDRKATLSPLLDARSTPLVEGRPFRVCLDPGHGGSDPGARSRDGRTAEASLTLDVARRVRALLEADGFDVQLTRADAATEQSLEERPAKARRWKADAFVSIHFNTNPGSASARGLETYVFPAAGMESTSYAGRRPSPESKLPWRGSASNAGNVQLGFCIQRRALAATKLPDRGLRRARFVVLREATVPAALVECGFLSSPEDLAYIRSEAGRDALARGIYEGICDFAFGTMAPGLPARRPPPAGSAPRPAPPAGGASAPPGSEPPIAIVQGDRPAPYVPPVPADAADPARRAAREAALRAAGIPSATEPKKEKP